MQNTYKKKKLINCIMNAALDLVLLLIIIFKCFSEIDKIFIIL